MGANAVGMSIPPPPTTEIEIAATQSAFFMWRGGAGGYKAARGLISWDITQKILRSNSPEHKER